MTIAEERIALNAVLIGKARPLGPRGVASGIEKSEIGASIVLGPTGFEGDEQGDPVHHGGPEKAVHHYPFEHYRRWQDAVGVHRLLHAPGAFGENLSTTGLTEDTVAIGDVFELGSATVEVSQGRQPCWKLNERFGLKGMSKLVQSSGMTGWYYRVIRPGTVSPHDALRRVERTHPEWTIAKVWRVFYVDVLNVEELARLAELPGISPGWRERAIKRLQSRKVEDWSKRLDG
ncbi:MAG: MOSC domain-containing protein [Mesorhizobium sp.]